MILNRLGNKKKLAAKILPLFPPHSVYIEPFFGAGAMFFAKPIVKHNFLNDLDSEVFNLWNVVKNDKLGLMEWVELMPVNEELFQWWRTNKETEPILKAVRFLMLSNFGYMGKPETMGLHLDNTKQKLLKNLKSTLLDLGDTKTTNKDFRKAITSIAWSKETDKDKAFMYLDPPYLGTTDNYSHSFIEQDSADLFKIAVESNIRFAMSEFNHPFILQQAADYKLNVINLGERQTMKSRQTEILVTNYSLNNTLF
jgi:DNA adenine methylase